MRLESVDEFTIDEEHEAIVCHSKSGNIYFLSLDGSGKLNCDCEKYKTQNHCRHVAGALFGLYNDELETVVKMKKAEEAKEVDKSRDNFCRECGRAFVDGDKFCGHCGKKRA